MLGGPALDFVNFAQAGRGKSLPRTASGGASNGMGRDIRAIHSLALLTSFWRLVPGRLYFFVGFRDAGNVLRHLFGEERERMSFILVSARLRTAALFIALSF